MASKKTEKKEEKKAAAHKPVPDGTCEECGSADPNVCLGFKRGIDDDRCRRHITLKR